MNRSKRGLSFYIIRGFLILIVLFLTFQLIYVFRIALFTLVNPSSTPYMRLEADRLAIEEGRQIQYEWVDYDKISPYVPQAVVAAEDSGFMHHDGILWSSIKKAAERNVLSEKKAPGGSTITQQTVKNLFLTHNRSYLRKAEEIFLSPIVELLWTKKRILEVYLNIAEFGDGIFGIQAAARHYFHKNALNLNRVEAIRLASILINPKRYQSVRHSKLLDNRVARIKEDMELVQVPK